MNEVISYILERLKEPSTWRGIIWLVTAVGFALSEEEKQAIATAGMTLVGLIGVFTKDNGGVTNTTPTKEEIQTLLDDHAEKVEKIVKEKKNAKSKKSDTDNFFND